MRGARVRAITSWYWFLASVIDDKVSTDTMVQWRRAGIFDGIAPAQEHWSWNAP
jgi:hypothetical protein